jgi:hypothetical protein
VFNTEVAIVPRKGGAPEWVALSYPEFPVVLMGLTASALKGSPHGELAIPARLSSLGPPYTSPGLKLTVDNKGNYLEASPIEASHLATSGLILRTKNDGELLSAQLALGGFSKNAGDVDQPSLINTGVKPRDLLGFMFPRSKIAISQRLADLLPGGIEIASPQKTECEKLLMGPLLSIEQSVDTRTGLPTLECTLFSKMTIWTKHGRLPSFVSRSYTITPAVYVDADWVLANEDDPFHRLRDTTISSRSMLPYQKLKDVKAVPALDCFPGKTVVHGDLEHIMRSNIAVANLYNSMMRP